MAAAKGSDADRSRFWGYLVQTVSAGVPGLSPPLASVVPVSSTDRADSHRSTRTRPGRGRPFRVPYPSDSRFAPGDTEVVQEVVLDSLFEGQTIGLNTERPFRVFTLDAPRRLVVDIRHCWALLQDARPGSTERRPARPCHARACLVPWPGDPSDPRPAGDVRCPGQRRRACRLTPSA